MDYQARMQGKGRTYYRKFTGMQLSKLINVNVAYAGTEFV